MRIVHVFRAPVGGLFRHVRDLARGHQALGHDVGLICDASTGGDAAGASLDALANTCSLGITRIPMPRLPGAGDLKTTRRVSALLQGIRPEIVHGHGAKGGLYARLSGPGCDAKSVYTPHGGVLHYAWSRPGGALYLSAEKGLLARTDGLIFVCDFERQGYLAKVGGALIPTRVIHNGLWPEEFNAITPVKTADDLLFIGELRGLKGVNDLLEAIALLNRDRIVTATLVGSGPDQASLVDKARALGVQDRVRFAGAMPAADAFPLGRLMVIPSRAESFPYIVLEAIAAAKPIIATRVGGIPEVLGADCLVEANSPAQLASKIASTLADPDAASAAARDRSSQVRASFSAQKMAAASADFYAELAGS